MSDTSLTVDGGPRTNGMPMLGLGTWENENPDQCAASVRTALETGYRHIDTAKIYGNERAVGRGIDEADVPREDVFLATKVWIDSLAYEDAIEATRAALDRLGVDAVDLMYVHWPARTYDAEETLQAFDELYDEGLIDRIGISNFEPDQVREAVSLTDAPVFANQVECHPMLPQEELRSVCADHDVEVVAYSPLARGAVFENETLSSVAAARDVSAAQVSLAWLREKGVTAIPKATSTDHIEDNWASLDLELTDEEVAAIDDIDVRRREVDPDFGPWN